MPLETLNIASMQHAVRQLPIDIIEEIISHDSRHLPTLKACSLCCSAWVYPSRRHLFASLRLRTDRNQTNLYQRDPVQYWVDLPHCMLPYVRWLSIELRGFWFTHRWNRNEIAALFADIISKCTHTVRLSVSSLPSDGHSKVPSPLLRNAVLDRLRSSALQSVDLDLSLTQEADMDYIRAIPPSVHRVSLLESDYPLHGASVAKLAPSSLTVTAYTSFEWLLHPGCPISFRRLDVLRLNLAHSFVQTASFAALCSRFGDTLTTLDLRSFAFSIETDDFDALKNGLLRALTSLTLGRLSLHKSSLASFIQRLVAYISDVHNLCHLTLFFAFENLSFDYIETEWVELHQ
ncbi:hypothetical protein BDZ89DRAFT_1164536 [Hymenopellis radicata]|nr:hypothetical protein BDZ89DRAFT_1164536 [Hymenopellis radicata]